MTAVRIVYCCWLPADWTPGRAPHDNWRVDPARAGGGAAIDLAPHGLDLVGALLGEDVVDLHAAAADAGAGLRRSTTARCCTAAPPAGCSSTCTSPTTPPTRCRAAGSRSSAPAGWPSPSTRWARPPAARSTLLAPRRRVDVPFGDASPFAGAVRAPSPPRSTATRAAWPYDAERDLRLHRLLLEPCAMTDPP